MTSYHADMATRGIHIITTTYGTWLPGDERGHWSPLFDMYGRLRRSGHQLNAADEVTRRRAQQSMNEPPKRLHEAEQQTVARVIEDFCRPCDPEHAPDSVAKKPRWLQAGWQRPLTVHALAIEENHMHLLLGPCQPDIGQVAGRVKSNASSAVLKIGSNAGRTRVWSTGYWGVFLFDDDAVRAVQDYIENHNVRRGLNRNRFGFARPI
jgi:hypothetical protein